MQHSYHGLLTQVLKSFNYASTEPQRTRMGFAPTTPAGIFLFNDLGPKITKYETILAIYDDPTKRTPVVVKQLKEAKKELEKSYRGFYAYTYKNPDVTDDDRVAMDLPVADTTRTPVPDPTSWPVAKLDLSTPGRVLITVEDSYSGKGKPFGVHEVMVRWKAFDGAQEERPAKELLTERKFSTTTSFHIEYDDSLEGKYFYYTMCWMNTRTVEGPYDRVQFVVLP
jgi:hypothetical protein